MEFTSALEFTFSSHEHKKIEEIPLDLIDPFPDHPFFMRDDEGMDALVESIRENGIITPATLHRKEDGRYEILSGHRRTHAAERAGLKRSGLKLWK